MNAVGVWTCVLAAVSLGAPLCDASDDGVTRNDCEDDVDSSAVGLDDGVESILDETLSVAPPNNEDDEDAVEDPSFAEAVGPIVRDAPTLDEELKDGRAEREDEELGEND
jgi:hypothetical protein